jgi:hypothetical protein
MRLCQRRNRNRALWQLRSGTLRENIFQREKMKRNRPKSLGNRRDVVYILAPSYTGSTLLTFLLAQHKDIATIGELKATARGDLSTYSCSCGALQRECAFWKQLTEEMQSAGTSFTLEDFGAHFQSDSPLTDRLLRAGIRGRFFELTRCSTLRLLPGGRRCLRDILERNQQLIEIICKLQGGKIFLDGSKDPVRLKFLSSADYWNVKTIYLIRDGRGATNSYMRHYSVSMETAAREWCGVHRECDRMVRELGDGISITIHYEDLCARPKEILNCIHAFLGLETDIGYPCFRTSDRHILGNEMRLRSVGEIKLDERWRSTLTERDLEVFEQIAGKLNRSYGYR